MPRALPSRRIPRHRPIVHRRPPRRSLPADRSSAVPVRLSDLILGGLGLTLLGGLGVMAVASLIARAVAPSTE